MAYPEEIVVPLADEAIIRRADEGLAAVDEALGDDELGQVAEGMAGSSWWPAGFVQWVVPLLVGAAVGAGLLWAATAEGGEESSW